MAALDFPASPTNGQVYGNWIWSDAKDAWQAKPLTPAVVATSDTAPLSPKDGDQWLNTVDGCLYVYYIDIDGGQWVQVKNDASFSSTLGPRVDALETFDTKIVGLKNIIPTSVVTNTGTATVNSLGVVTFPNVAYVRLNGVFTNKFTNYRILIRSVKVGDSSSILYTRFASNGSDRMDSYSGGSKMFNITGSTITSLNGGDGIYLCNNYYAGLHHATLDVRADNVNVPYLSGLTTGSVVTDGTYGFASGVNGYATVDGISLNTNNGSMSGSIQVFGYNTV